MRTRIQGLSQPPEPSPLVAGAYRARVVRFGPAGHAAKHCRAATFLILEPAPYAGRSVRTRLYCHERALWKVRWFLRDFHYDAELLAAEELDDRRVLGLEGVIRLAYWGQDRHRRLDVQGFAHSECWGDLPAPLPALRPPHRGRSGLNPEAAGAMRSSGEATVNLETMVSRCFVEIAQCLPGFHIALVKPRLGELARREIPKSLCLAKVSTASGSDGIICGAVSQGLNGCRGLLPSGGHEVAAIH
jgi:hypothetical protein